MFVKRSAEQFGIDVGSGLSCEDAADIVVVSVFLVEIIVGGNVFCNVRVLNELVDDVFVYLNLPILWRLRTECHPHHFLYGKSSAGGVLNSLK